MNDLARIGLVTNGLYTPGGISSVCWFLYQIISSSDRFDIQLFSVESAYNHPLNVRILDPKSWLRGVRIEECRWRNIPTRHVGTYLSEFEFQRYMPQKELTNLLNQFDLIQVVSGSPALAYITRNVEIPVCLQAATMMKLERKSLLRRSRGVRKIYSLLMLPIISEIEKRALQKAAHIFANTEYTRKALLPYTDISKVSIDSIGVDIDKFWPLEEEKRTDSYILSVGRFEDVRKNIGLLFDAYAIVRKHMPNLPKLILAGQTAPYPAAWARAVALGIDGFIELRINISSEELVDLYQNAAVFVLPSDEEGLGIVLLESMACATPVISTCSGGPDSIVSDQVGWLTPIGDAQKMADCLLWNIQNPTQRRSMGLAGRRMVETRFSIEAVGKKYLDVYDKFIGADS